MGELALLEGTPKGAGVHLHFEVNDVDRVWSMVRERGIEVAEAPEDKPWGQREFGLRDPD